MAAAFDVKNVPPGTRLELYVSPSCPYCAQALDYYERAGTPVEVHDAQNDPDARRLMLRYTGGDPTVPAIIINGAYVQSGWGTPPRG
jgi:glutaredoxin 3